MIRGRGREIIPLEYSNEVTADLADAVHSYYFPRPQVMGREPAGFKGAMGQLDHAPKEFLWELPRIVIIPRTGYMVGDKIARKWGMPGVSILHACIGRNEEGGFEYGQFPTQEDIEGGSFVIVDGVTKSGESMAQVKQLFIAAGAGHVVTATMFDKPKECTAGAPPDFVGDWFMNGSFLVLPGEEDEHVFARSSPN